MLLNNPAAVRSNRPTIVVTKTGQAINMDDGVSPRGELDTPPLLRWLGSRDDINVIFLGHVRGDVPDNIAWFNFDSKHIVDMDDVKERCDPVIDEVLSICIPLFVLNSTGCAFTWCSPDGTNELYQSTIAYSSCPTYLMSRIGPRVCLVTDPKCYPIEGDITLRYDGRLRPVAVLSQEDVVFPKSIRKQKYEVHGVYSGCENWLTWEWEQIKRDKIVDVAICQNGHFKDTRTNPKRYTFSRAEEWETILEHSDRSNTQLCGKGWNTDADWYHGVLKHTLEVRHFLAEGERGTMLPQKNGFMTTKARILALSNCAPCFYGAGNEDTRFVYDAHERVLPFDHEARLPHGRSIVEHRLFDHSAVIEEVLEKTTPDFSKLLKLIDAFIDGPVFDEAWVKEFGGYVPCV